MTDHPDQLGEFAIHAVLGRGGSGVVYDATWGPRRVALKVLHAHLIAGDRERSQFFTEAARLQTLSHPSVVKVFGAGTLPDGRPFLAMERLEGQPLASVLARGALAPSRALALFGDLCGAVQALHDQGLVHRDLKPENVFVVADHHAVLLDFGIAKELAAPASTTTIDGGVRGTPAYMAPERFFGQPASVATDIYELAVTLYAMLAGRLPWDDLGDPEARLSPHSLIGRAPVTAELDVEIRRALSTRAQNRPPSATALRVAVEQASGRPDDADASAAQPHETGRLPQSPPEPPAGSWFADRQASTDRGKTPLAWAPTERATPPAQRQRSDRKYLRIAAVTAGVLAAGVSWKLRNADNPSDNPVVADASIGEPPARAAATLDAAPPPEAADPWAATTDPPSEPVPTLEATAPALTVDQARREIAAAIRHVPADTRAVVTVSLVELRANSAFDDLLGAVRKVAIVEGFIASTPPCVQAALASAQWAIFAGKSLSDSTNGVLILRGRWTRAAIEQCFASREGKQLELVDGPITQLPRIGWLDFLDDHTAYLSIRDDLAAAQVRGLVTRGSGPTARTQQLLARAPADRAAVAAVDGGDDLEWAKDYLPRGSDAVAWLRVAEQSDLEVIGDPHSVDAANQLVAKVKPEFAKVFGDRASGFLGTVKVFRDGTTMRIQARLSSLLVSMIAARVSS